MSIKPWRSKIVWKTQSRTLISTATVSIVALIHLCRSQSPFAQKCNCTNSWPIHCCKVWKYQITLLVHCTHIFQQFLSFSDNFSNIPCHVPGGLIDTAAVEIRVRSCVIHTIFDLNGLIIRKMCNTGVVWQHRSVLKVFLLINAKFYWGECDIKLCSHFLLRWRLFSVQC